MQQLLLTDGALLARNRTRQTGDHLEQLLGLLVGKPITAIRSERVVRAGVGPPDP